MKLIQPNNLLFGIYKCGSLVITLTLYFGERKQIWERNLKKYSNNNILKKSSKLNILIALTYG